ncbi:MAG: SRPBCC domain-containing protein [Anaerolineae bacterium]|nr:SRPBCC domain-containing protein [Anaerolineae bacterium]
MTSTNNELKLQITRRFAVAPDIVFDALTNPAAMKIWWGDDAIIEIDLRVGGRWQITRYEDGVEYIAVGEYLVVERPFRLVYTFGMPQFSPNSDTIAFEITADASSCVVTFQQSGEDTVKELSELAPGTVSQSEAGWRQGFDLMAAAWEKN